MTIEPSLADVKQQGQAHSVALRIYKALLLFHFTESPAKVDGYKALK